MLAWAGSMGAAASNQDHHKMSDPFFHADPRCDMAEREAMDSGPTCHRSASLLQIGKSDPA